jgi:SAM-dependent methyltransferase
MYAHTVDPLSGSTWSRDETVAGFVAAAPNATLLDYAARTLRGAPRPRAVDIGGGAGRNAVPLAAMGWTVIDVDLSWPMLQAAAARARDERLPHLHPVLAPMERLPLRDGSSSFVVAHGIWNLAGSGGQFRAAVAEAARIASPGARLFVFTFSRSTLGADLFPLAGETFVFSQFSGEPQCFLTVPQLLMELGHVGFAMDPESPVRELNRPQAGTIARGGPVILEGGFVRR